MAMGPSESAPKRNQDGEQGGTPPTSKPNVVDLELQEPEVLKLASELAKILDSQDSEGEAGLESSIKTAAISGDLDWEIAHQLLQFDLCPRPMTESNLVDLRKAGKTSEVAGFIRGLP